jgi:hypothetical protein
MPQKPVNTILEGRGGRSIWRMTLRYPFLHVGGAEASGDDERLTGVALGKAR